MGRSGAAVVTQRLSSDLILNIHGHILAADGVWNHRDGQVEFRPAPPLGELAVQEVLHDITLQVDRQLIRLGFKEIACSRRKRRSLASLLGVTRCGSASARTAWAEAPETESDSAVALPPHGAVHGVYLEGATIGCANAVGLSYQRLVSPRLVVSAGLGRGWATTCPLEGSPRAVANGVAAQGMAHLLLGNPARTGKFELAAGVARYINWLKGNEPFGLLPAGFIGLRARPAHAGFLFRIGGGWVYASGGGLAVSVGAVF